MLRGERRRRRLRCDTYVAVGAGEGNWAAECFSAGVLATETAMLLIAAVEVQAKETAC